MAARLQKAVAVAPRVDVHVPTLTHPGLETAHGGKAGIDRDDAVTAFRRAALDPWLTPVGLHLHVGSQITSVEPYRQAVATALDVVEEVEQAAGVRLEFLDAGGGFAVPYREPLAADASGSAVPPSACRLLLVGARHRRLRRRDLPRPRGAAAGPHAFPRARPVRGDDDGVLVTRVENVKTKKVRGAGGEVAGDEDWLTIDAGYNTLLDHTNFAWYFRSVRRRAGPAEPADTPLPVGGASLRRRGRVRRRRRHAVPALPGRRRAWATWSSSSRPAATRSR